jgi:hypothetical protein
MSNPWEEVNPSGFSRFTMSNPWEEVKTTEKSASTLSQFRRRLHLNLGGDYRSTSFQI